MTEGPPLEILERSPTLFDEDFPFEAPSLSEASGFREDKHPLHFIKPINTRLSLSKIFGWYWPTSNDKAAITELDLLAHGNLRDDITLTDTEIGPDIFIHTLIMKHRKIGDMAEDNKADIPQNVVFCHGFGAGLAFFYKNYKPIFTALNSKGSYNVYGLDWLGMGRSSRPRFPGRQRSSLNNIGVSFSHKEEDLSEAFSFFVESLELWRKETLGENATMHLIGHSLGGYLVSFYALKYPQYISKLYLASPVGVPSQLSAPIRESFKGTFPIKSAESSSVSVTGRKLPSWIAHLWNRDMTPMSLIRSVGPYGPSLVQRYTKSRFSYLPDAELQLLTNYLYHISADNGSGEFALSRLLTPGAWAKIPLDKAILNGIPYKRTSEMSNLTDCPNKNTLPSTKVLFLYGQEDWMDWRQALPILSNNPHWELFRISNAGHHLYLDNPEEFNEILVREILNV